MAITLTPPPLIFPLLFMFIFFLIPSCGCPFHQKQALISLKSIITTIYHPNSSFNDEYTSQFTSWTRNSSCCSWEGVDCYKTKTVVIGLKVYGHYYEVVKPVMVSDILAPIFHIRSLKFLMISIEGLVGEIVGDGFRNLTQLVSLDMQVNNLSGFIPPQLFELKSLRSLDLSYNYLQGALSPEVGKLGSLEYMYLQGNLLSGYIPQEIGNLTKLRKISLNDNLFIGGLPSSIENMKELEMLDFSGNSLSMQIPSGIGGLPIMTLLDLSRNEFMGPIPSSIGNLSKLDSLFLQNNKLSGEIPTLIFKIESLTVLYIGGKGSNLTWNNKAKIVPRCSLREISITYSGISGHVPQWISSQKDLKRLELSGNKLEGRFPDWLTKIDLEFIVITNNMLNGSIPPPLFESKSLRILALSHNKLSGELPKNIGNATLMWILMLSGNNISGQIPMSVSNMHQLIILDLSRNKFFGENFPIFGGKFLSYLDLSDNELSGKISLTFSIKIENLLLGGNKFSGNMPWNLSKLIHLERLDLHDNDIIGNIQDILPQISTLRVLNLRNNSLEGFIPRRISELTSLHILDLSSNNLTGSIPWEIAYLPSMIETSSMPTSTYDFTSYSSDIEYFNVKLEIQDLKVNWKYSFQGLSNHNLDIYSFIDLSNNRISGEIPESLGNLKDLIVLTTTSMDTFQCHLAILRV